MLGRMTILIENDGPRGKPTCCQMNECLPEAVKARAETNAGNLPSVSCEVEHVVPEPGAAPPDPCRMDGVHRN